MLGEDLVPDLGFGVDHLGSSQGYFGNADGLLRRLILYIKRDDCFHCLPLLIGKLTGLDLNQQSTPYKRVALTSCATGQGLTSFWKRTGGRRNRRTQRLHRPEGT